MRAGVSQLRLLWMGKACFLCRLAIQLQSLECIMKLDIFKHTMEVWTPIGLTNCVLCKHNRSPVISSICLMKTTDI